MNFIPYTTVTRAPMRNEIAWISRLASRSRSTREINRISFPRGFDRNKASRWEFLINPKSVWLADHSRASRGIRGRIVWMENLWAIYSRGYPTQYTYTHIHAHAHIPNGGNPRGQAGVQDEREPFAGDHNQLAHASRILAPLASIRVAVNTAFVCAPCGGTRQ